MDQSDLTVEEWNDLIVKARIPVHGGSPVPDPTQEVLSERLRCMRLIAEAFQGDLDGCLSPGLRVALRSIASGGSSDEDEPWDKSELADLVRKHWPREVSPGAWGFSD